MEDIPTNFYLLNAVVAGGLIFYLIWRKPRSRALKKVQESSPKKGLKDLVQELEEIKKEDIERPVEPPASENVMFNWNGHSWDAYEVLGIPPGSSRQLVDKAFEQEMAKMDEESRAFIQKAYQAIISK